MKKITIILILVAVLSVYPVFNIVGLARDSVVPDETDLSEGTNIIETLVGFDVRKAQKNVTSAEKKRNERLEGYKELDVFSQLEPGTYYAEIVIAEDGDYIPEANVTEYSGLSCVFELTVE